MTDPYNYEERAAILEYMAGLPREVAERKAAVMIEQERRENERNNRQVRQKSS